MWERVIESSLVTDTHFFVCQRDNCEQSLNTLRYADRVKERNSETGCLSAKSTVQRGGRRASILPPGYFTTFLNIVNSNTEEYPATEVNGHNVDPTVSSSKSQDDENETCQKLGDDSQSPTYDLVKELLDTHHEFLAAVLGMVQDEILLVDQLKTDGKIKTASDLVAQLETNQGNQLSLISDLRECFQTYESIQGTLLDGELVSHHKLALVALLDTVHDEMVFVKKMSDDGSGALEDATGQLVSIQQRKLSLLSDLRECFEATGTRAATATAEVIFSESFKSETDKKHQSDDDSFEDLRD